MINRSSCSHSFAFFYCKIVIKASHSFKFTVFLQNRNCNKKILTIIIIPPWFQECIYWKKFVSWRHHFQPSNFSMIVSLFHGSTRRNPHVKEILLISQYFLPPSIIISSLWLIREKDEDYVYFRKTIVALLFRGIYSFHWTSCNNFFKKYCVKCTKVLAEIPFFHERASWNYLHFFKNFKTHCGVCMVNFLEEQL